MNIQSVFYENFYNILLKISSKDNDLILVCWLSGNKRSITGIYSY